MLETPLHKLIPAMALPSILAMIISSIYSFGDTFFVSQLGKTAVSAVGINHSLDMLIMMAGSMMGMGAGSYISRLMGAQDIEKAEQVFVTSLVTAFGFGAIVTVLGTIFMKPLVRVLGATPEIEQYSLDYAKWVLLAAPVMASNFVLNQALRAEGSATLSMAGMAIGNIIDFALNPLFIITFDLGIGGASSSTAISKTISFCILIYPYIRNKSLIKLNMRNMKYSVDIVTEVAKMGSPALIRTGMNIVTGTILNRTAAADSTSALAAISVTNRLMQMVGSMSMGLGQGYQPVVGFCWGAKRYKRIKEAFWFTVFSSACVLGVLAIIYIIFAQQLIGVFNSEADAEMLKIGMFALRMQSSAIILMSFSMTVNMAYAGTGKAMGSMLLSGCRQGIMFLPMVLILPRMFGTMGIAAVQAGADFMTLAVSIPLAVHILKEINRLALEDTGEVDLESIDIEELMESMVQFGDDD